MPGGAGQRAGGESGESRAPAASGARVSAFGSMGREGSGSAELAQALPIPTLEPAQKQFPNCRSPSDAQRWSVSPGFDINVRTDVRGRNRGEGSCQQFSRGQS